MEKTKKSIWILSLIVMAFTGCQKSNHFTLNGSVVGKTDGHIVLDLGGKKIETKIEEGHFYFEVPKVQTDLAHIVIGGEKFPFFIENTALKITLYTDSLDKSIVLGSELHSACDKFKKQEDEFMRDLFLKMKKYELADEEQKDKYFRVLFKEREDEAKKFINQYLNTPLAPYLIHYRFKLSMGADELQNWFNQCSTKAKESATGIMLQTFITNKKNLKIGKPYIDFACRDREGRDVKFSSVFDDKKIIILDFWASWCAPCRQEAKNILKIYNELNDKGLDVFSVSIDKDKKKWLKALDHDGLPWHNLIQDTDINDNTPSVLYNVDAIPAIFILSGDGTILARDLRGEELNEFCKNYISID
jgi:peroxiredoxin